MLVTSDRICLINTAGLSSQNEKFIRGDLLIVLLFCKSTSTQVEGVLEGADPDLSKLLFQLLLILLSTTDQQNLRTWQSSANFFTITLIWTVLTDSQWWLACHKIEKNG